MKQWRGERTSSSSGVCRDIAPGTHFWRYSSWMGETVFEADTFPLFFALAVDFVLEFGDFWVLLANFSFALELPTIFSNTFAASNPPSWFAVWWSFWWSGKRASFVWGANFDDSCNSFLASSNSAPVSRWEGSIGRSFLLKVMSLPVAWMIRGFIVSRPERFWGRVCDAGGTHLHITGSLSASLTRSARARDCLYCSICICNGSLRSRSSLYLSEERAEFSSMPSDCGGRDWWSGNMIYRKRLICLWCSSLNDDRMTFVTVRFDLLEKHVLFRKWNNMTNRPVRPLTKIAWH